MKLTVLIGLAALPLSACAPYTTTTTTVAASPAEANCLAAVAKETNTTGTTTKSVTPSEAGTSVMVNVPGATAPWICATDASGNVTNVMFSGEG